MNQSSPVLDRSASQAIAPEAGSIRGRPMLRGVHHLALNTDDLKSTLNFYVKVLGMPLIGGLLTGKGAAAGAETRGNPPFDNIAHYFIDMGGDSTIAFFEYPKGAVPKANRDSLATMQHVSFAAGPAQFEAVKQRLHDAGIDITFGPMVLVAPNIQTMYFYDPNGIRLEITCDLDGHETQLNVIETLTLTPEAMRRELLTISDDEAWIEDMVDHLPEGASKFGRDRYDRPK